MIKTIESINQTKPSFKCHCLENSLNHKVKNTGETEVITIIIFKNLLSINTFPPQSYLILKGLRLTFTSFFSMFYLYFCKYI